ncbi:MAG: exodeoxyribonuclease VII large subunit [Candidatus Omnitrophica bacterium]|nr:exodeoxyribonuclease VII large subunit [Candidatus Omnitrophota bacterium]MCM8793095.1 exodeoxyribonuclease VII large subunit [Candidatus Omnitrophota bacterium]
MEIKLKTEKVYSIRELNAEVKGILKREFPELIWVCGEIQDYNKNKHKPDVYFRLCEKHPEVDEVIASVSAVIFKDRKLFLNQILKHALLELKDDLEVKFLCRVDFSKYGKLLLIVEDIDPVYTLGKIAQSRQKIIEELKAKGLLEKNKRLNLPLVPLNIGLITSYNSAAYNDFLDELKRSGYGFKIYYFDSAMQGKNVEPNICSALEIFDQIPFLDLVVITRGGGSTADLSWFDNKKIAERIANAKFPVLTGIGHEIDVTIADRVAHTYFKTPTAIAQFLVGRVKDFLDNLDEKIESLIAQTEEILSRESQTLGIKAKDINLETQKFLRDHREKLISLIKEIKICPANLVYTLKINLKEKTKELSMETFHYLKNKKIEVSHYEEKIKILDPMNTVKRGFSITKAKDGKTIKSIEDTKKDEDLVTIVFDGKIESKVKRIKKE